MAIYKMDTSSLRVCSIILLLFTCNIISGSENEYSGTAELRKENLRKLAIANNYFALHLYGSISSGSSKNILFSPLSLSSAFGMLFYGTRGDTSKELRDVLGYDEANLPSELVPYAFNHFLTESLSASGTEHPEYNLSLANLILLDTHFKLLFNYKLEVHKLFKSSAQEVDFYGDEANIVNNINSWVKEETNSKIDRLVDGVDPNAHMILLSAVYFKGAWNTEFQKEKTSLKKFYNEGSQSDIKLVPFMHVEDKFPYAEINDYKALELPYKGEHISMIILLPNRRKGYLKLDNNLTQKKLSTIRRELSHMTVQVSLPKFKFEYNRELSHDLRRLGARSLFYPHSANFSGMTNQKYLYVSTVLHKTVVEVNEEGSEAAAVTSIGVSLTSHDSHMPKIFTADHPFLFMIIDKRSDMILFVGRVSDL